MSGFVLTKRENEVVKLTFNFERVLETIWQPAKEYDATDYVRPTRANGFEYEATHSGTAQSGVREPKWPTTAGNTVTDGSVTWTARAFSTNATDTISTRTVTADSGLTVDSSAIDARTVTATISGGTAPGMYDVVCQIVTAAGETLEEKAKIKVVE